MCCTGFYVANSMLQEMLLVNPINGRGVVKAPARARRGAHQRTPREGQSHQAGTSLPWALE